MKNRVLAAATVAALVALSLCAIVLPARRARPGVVRAALDQPLPEIGETPGLGVESRAVEIGADGIPHLRVKVRNRANKQLVAWSVVIADEHGYTANSFVADPGHAVTDERDLEKSIPLDEIRPGASVSVAAVYDDGEAQGSSKFTSNLRGQVARKRGWHLYDDQK